MAITKTDFMRGMQCRKMLWLDKHRPGLRVIPPEIRASSPEGEGFSALGPADLPVTPAVIKATSRRKGPET